MTKQSGTDYVVFLSRCASMITTDILTRIPPASSLSLSCSRQREEVAKCEIHRKILLFIASADIYYRSSGEIGLISRELNGTIEQMVSERESERAEASE
jgi:hypothetical protein